MRLPIRNIKLPIRSSGTCYSPHCSKCGKGIILASHPLSQEKINSILIEIGWELNPILCSGCSCPMEYWERVNCETKYQKRKPDFEEYKNSMIKKYGEKAERYFNRVCK